MARQVRVGFPGAIYPAMARGTGRNPSRKDERDAFGDLLEELVERTGFEVFAWVFMTNHFYLAFKTPEPELVEGMKWFQKTWTKWFNARHRLWGHLFGGCYRGIKSNEDFD